VVTNAAKRVARIGSGGARPGAPRLTQSGIGSRGRGFQRHPRQASCIDPYFSLNSFSASVFTWMKRRKRRSEVPLQERNGG
jgi:hypothetical protein